MEHGSVKLLIPTPNATNKCGFNTDRFVFDPTCNSRKDAKHFRFLGILFGVAMRTKKPLDLHLAQPMWKLVAGMTLTAEDLEEVSRRPSCDHREYCQTSVYSQREYRRTGVNSELRPEGIL